MSQRYYQVGGFEGHLKGHAPNWFDEKPLVEALAGPKSPLRSKDPSIPLELVLGIKRTGASHLLLTADETHIYTNAMRLPFPRALPFPADAFESLSPIYFDNTADLGKKLATLKPKSQKGRGRGGDTSQANRGYVGGNEDTSRGTFEHGRLLYGVLRHSVDFDKYSLRDVSWLQSLRVCSFVFNTKSADDRRYLERLQHPSVLDMGFAEAELPTLDVKENSAKHLVKKMNSYINRGSPKLAFRFGRTETLDDQLILAHIVDFLALDEGRPIILLASDMEMTKNVLIDLNLDVSEWHSGIEALVGFGSAAQEQNPSSSASQRHDPRKRNNPSEFSSNAAGPHTDYEMRRARPRSRSRSPGRPSPHASYIPRPEYGSTANHPQRRAQGKSKIFPASIHVVDVKKMFMTMMKETERPDNPPAIPTIAERLGIPLQERGWCAGNEAALIIDVWRKMISGPPIDEQREIRISALSMSSLYSSQPTDDGTLDLDEERDPNDVVPPLNNAGTLVQPGGAYDPDDVSDYGSD